MNEGDEISGSFAFKLYDTFGFPIDLTELLARENGFAVDKNSFTKDMDAQKKRAREAHKSVDILVSDSIKLYESTEFVGYDSSKLSNFEVNFKERITR